MAVGLSRIRASTAGSTRRRPREGASLTIAGSASIAVGTVTGGASNWQAGQAFANGIYLQGNNTLTFSPTGTQTVSGIIGDDAGSDLLSVYSGPAGYTQGVVALTVNGTGTLVLTGSQAYTGATTVAEGRLLVDGTTISAVTVQSGGTLGGIGYVTEIGLSSTHRIESGGTLAPGDNGAGKLTFNGDLTLSSGATFAVELGGSGRASSIRSSTFTTARSRSGRRSTCRWSMVSFRLPATASASSTFKTLCRGP